MQYVILDRDMKDKLGNSIKKGINTCTSTLIRANKVGLDFYHTLNAVIKQDIKGKSVFAVEVNEDEKIVCNSLGNVCKEYTLLDIPPVDIEDYIYFNLNHYSDKILCTDKICFSFDFIVKVIQESDRLMTSGKFSELLEKQDHLTWGQRISLLEKVEEKLNQIGNSVYTIEDYKKDVCITFKNCIPDVFHDYFPVNYILRWQLPSEQFMIEHEDVVGDKYWNNLIVQKQFSEEFIELYSDKFDWYIVLENQKLSEDFLDKYYDELPKNMIALHQPITREFLTKHIDVMIVNCLKDNPYIDEELRNECIKSVDKSSREKLTQKELEIKEREESKIKAEKSYQEFMTAYKSNK